MVITAQNINQKPGYKQTEVGEIPEDWGVKTLGEIADLTSSKRIFEHEYVSSGIPFYRGKEISQLIDGEQISDKYFILESRYNQIKSEFGVPNKRDILITAVGTLGNVYVVPDESSFYFKDGNLIWLRNIKNADSYYIAAQIRKKRSEIVNNAIGSSQKALTIVVLKSILMPYPTLLEQRSIATALSDVDALITSLEKLIIKKHDIKQATMQQLLTGKMRLPGFGGEWVVKKLGEVVDIVSGGTPSTTVAKFWHGDIKWCTPTDITRTRGKYLTNTEKCISEVGLKYSSANLLPIGSLLLCSRATIGEIKIAASIVCTNQGFKSLICSKDVSNEFLYYVILTIKSKLVEKAIGSTFLEISKKDTASLEIALPPLPEQTAIAAILSDMDAEITALEQKLEKLRGLKQGMMQELLTGKTRLL